MIETFRPNGTCLDLANPLVTDFDFDWIARRLSRINRFNGDGISVAQHSVMGAQALINEGQPRIVAAYFLLHDAHEFAIGDLTTPVQEAISESVRPQKLYQTVKNGIDLLKEKWDEAIYAAAGLIPPSSWPVYVRHDIKSMDNRMLVAEATELFGPRARNHLPVSGLGKPKLTGTLAQWGQLKAEEKFISMLADFIGQDRIARQKAAFDTACEKALRT